MNMVKIKNKDNSDVQILVSGLVILTVCLLACIFHISDLYSSFRTRINNDFISCMTSSKEALEDNISKTNDVLSSTKVALEAFNNIPSNLDISETLKKFESAEEYKSFLYIKEDGTIYDSEGIVSGGQFVNLYKSIQFTKLNTIQFNNYFSEGQEENLVIFVMPIHSSTGTLDHIVAQKSYISIFNENNYDLLRKNGAGYFVNGTGYILGKAENDFSFISNHSNLFKGLVGYSDNSVTSNSKIRDLETAMKKKENFKLTMYSSIGNRSILFAVNLGNTNGLYLVGGYNEERLLLEMKPTILRSVLTCIIIILLMIALIIYVWASAKRANLTIETLAYTDQVTQGKNANYFRDKALQIMASHRETPFIAQRFDIVNFRYLNEAYGHNRADEVLKACIEIFREHFTDKELCVRMDSDQFLTLNVNDTRVDQRRSAYIVALNEHICSLGIKYPIRLKFGIYQIRKQDLDIDVIIDHANVARKSLAGGEKTLIAYYSDAIVRDMRKIDKIESDMQNALINDEFKVFLQPKWDIIEDKVVGAEALVRWIKPDHTIIFPDFFIPIFEKNGFIERLDFFMLESVCKTMIELKDQGKTIYPVSVNQSRLLLHNPEYINRVGKILKKYEIPKEYIELELTETVFFDDREKMIEIMNQLKELHVKLSMDDFGSGYSSLNLLKDIPFDILKIDREFFSESITTQSATWILQKIIEMAEGLGIEVICEGVETREQIEILKKIGCRKVQGYFYSKPIPTKEFIEKYCGEIL